MILNRLWIPIRKKDHQFSTGQRSSGLGCPTSSRVSVVTMRFSSSEKASG
jgi:hypothetical protein